MNENIMQKMAAAAEVARKDLLENPPADVKELVWWLRKHYLDAGYKRLCKILFEVYNDSLQVE